MVSDLLLHWHILYIFMCFVNFIKPAYFDFYPRKRFYGLGVRVMVFNSTFNNISALLWQSVLLVGKTGVPGKNIRLIASH